jgi:ubiquinone/menaquinone biosynthesis C-methylase UbiE
MMTELDPYGLRPMSELYPDLERLGAEYHARHHEEGPLFTPAVLECLPRIVAPRHERTGLVLGCGPKPRAMLAMADAGFQVIGIEPVSHNVAEAQLFVGERGAVIQGSAEDIPLGDGTQDFVLMESVLEHVDSPPRSLAEVYRVLRPGGVLYVYTTCRTKFHTRGFNGEYNVPFLNWFPAIVREAYVHHQQHFQPDLANFNARPAFHWYTYTELVRLGRYTGFAQFYSLIDVAGPDSIFVRGSWLRRAILPRVRRNPWLRALALTQSGGSIFMVKRSA